jgi:hypothetical protein
LHRFGIGGSIPPGVYNAPRETTFPTGFLSQVLRPGPGSSHVE